QLKSQTITFNQPATPQIFGATFTPIATSNSGLTVTFGVSGGCSIDLNNMVTMTSGTTACVMTASQARNTNYSAATNVPHTVDAQLKSQTITFNQPATPQIFGATFTPTATSNSGLTVTFGVSAGSSLVRSNLVTMTSGGTACVLTASQAGNTNYSAAANVQRTVV